MKDTYIFDPDHAATKPSPIKYPGEDVAATNWGRYMRAVDAGHEKYIRNAARNNNFYMGEQWEAADLARLAKARRPALTINKVLTTVNTLLGEQRTRRADFQFKPSRDGHENVATSLTKLAMAVSEDNRLEYLESDVFADGVIEGRGYFDVRMNFDDSPEGDVEVTVRDPRLVIPDPNATEYDPKHWDEVFVHEWMSVEDIADRFGQEKADQVQNASLRAGASNKYYRFEQQGFGTDTGDTSHLTTTSTSKEDRRLKEVLVVERQYHRYVTIYTLVNPKTGKQKELPRGTKLEVVRRMSESLDQMPFKTTTRKLVRWTTFIDKVLLHDDWSPYKTFTIVPYFCFFRRGKPFSLVDNLISPQEQLNKIRSQMLHIVNTTANSGWIAEVGALNNMTPEELAKKGSGDGLVIIRNPGKDIQKITPNQVPSGLREASLSAAMDIKEISGVSDALLGMEGGEVSGVALKSKEKRGQVQMQVPLDNLARTRAILGRKFLELFQAFYTEERVLQITNDAEPGQPREPFIINEVAEDGSVVNDITLGKYDLIVSTQPARDGYNDSQFAEALNMRSVGVPIPSYRVAMFSNLGSKVEIAKELRDMEGLGVPTEEQQQEAAKQQQFQFEMMMAELQKTQAQVKELMARAALAEAKASQVAEHNDIEAYKVRTKAETEDKGFALRREQAAQREMAGFDQNEQKHQQSLQQTLIKESLTAKNKPQPETETNR